MPSKAKLLITDFREILGTNFIEIYPKAYSGKPWNAESAYIDIDHFSICEDVFLARIPGFSIYSFNIGLSPDVAQIIARDLAFRTLKLISDQSVEMDNLPDMLASKFQKLEWSKEYLIDAQNDWVASELIELVSDLSNFMKSKILAGGEWCALGI